MRASDKFSFTFAVSGGLALETAGGERRRLFKNGGATPK
jgi:hypothetical protein